MRFRSVARLIAMYFRFADMRLRKIQALHVESFAENTIYTFFLPVSF